MGTHSKAGAGPADAGAAGPARKRLCVEGWRFIHHSYAVVNQWQLLALLKRSDIALSVRDLPFFQHRWQRVSGLFDAEDENALATIPSCGGSDSETAILRLSFPLDFSARSSIRTAVFGTAEIQTVVPSQLAAPVDLRALVASDTFMVITPSQWSRIGFLRLGLRPEKVKVLPHGIQSGIFRPLDHEQRRPSAHRGFTFANVSSMGENKGIDLLLRAFAVVAERRPDVQLLLKGSDGIYSSRALLNNMLADLPTRSRSVVVDRMQYCGDAISMRRMADFYRAADAFVAPYRAEAFNLPVLEASACGTPVICTRGGPTDDFMRDSFALFIDSLVTPFQSTSFSGFQLKPSLDHLVELMFRVMDDGRWRNDASRMGASHAATHYDWDRIADRLLNTIFDGVPCSANDCSRP